MRNAKSKNDRFNDIEYRTITKLSSNTYSGCALAKLNITLSIGSKDRTGFHKVSSIMQAVSLHDRITLKKVTAGHGGIEGYVVKDNIISKTLEELSKEVGKKLHCRINLQKTIPMAAGLAGGSSDAAAVLRIANQAFGLDMGLHDLEKVAQKVGNDVSFLLYGGRAMVVGAKEHKITPMEVPDLYYIIARPRMELSTKRMYELYDKTGKDFTELACELCPDTERLLSQARKAHPAESGVTGKGPTVFAAYKTYKECESVSRNMSWLDGDIFIERAVRAFI